MDYYINPIRSWTDENGIWWIEFKEKDVIEMFDKYRERDDNKKQ